MSKRLKALSLMFFGVALMAPAAGPRGGPAAELSASPRRYLQGVAHRRRGHHHLAVIAGAFCQPGHQRRVRGDLAESGQRARPSGSSSSSASSSSRRVIYALLITIIITMVKWGQYV
jgi:hypothetical protein